MLPECFNKLMIMTPLTISVHTIGVLYVQAVMVKSTPCPPARPCVPSGAAAAAHWTRSEDGPQCQTDVCYALHSSSPSAEPARESGRINRRY